MRDPAPWLSPTVWARGLAAPPILCSATAGWSGALLRRWRDIDGEISQPALDKHYLTIHLGGPKHVVRRGEGIVRDAHVTPGALSITPAGAAFHWTTIGPIDFAHLYISPMVVRQIGIEVFDRDGSGLAIEDRLGIVDPLVQTLFAAMIEEVETGVAGSRVYLDTLLDSLLVRLLRLHGGGNRRSSMVGPSLAPVRLRRVYDFIEANVGRDVGVADMAAVAAVSQFHFSRAFASAAGVSPYAYLIARRIARAKHLLGDPDLQIAAVAKQCGFHTAGQFSRLFKRSTEVTPRQFRRNGTLR